MKNTNEWKSIPLRCPECAKDPETYYGRLALPGDEFGVCPNHRTKQDPDGLSAPALVPVKK